MLVIGQIPHTVVATPRGMCLYGYILEAAGEGMCGVNKTCTELRAEASRLGLCCSSGELMDREHY